MNTVADKGKKSKKAGSSTESSPIPLDLMETLAALPDEIGSMISRVDQIESEIRELGKHQVQNLKTAAAQLAEEEKMAVMAAEEARRQKEKEEDELRGPVSRGLRKVVNLLPSSKRERNMFVGGYLLGTSTSSILAPIAIIGAGVAKGRVVIGR